MNSSKTVSLESRLVHRNFDLARGKVSVTRWIHEHDVELSYAPQYTAMFVLEDALKPALARGSRTVAVAAR